MENSDEREYIMVILKTPIATSHYPTILCVSKHPNSAGYYF